MKTFFSLIIFIFPITVSIHAADEASYFFEKDGYEASFWNPMPEEIQEKIEGNSWTEDCPVPLEDLAYVQITHWNFCGEKQVGEMMVHKNLAQEITEIFYDLFLAKFPLEKIHLIEDYDIDDEMSMRANNSSAFCSRANATFPGQYSKHSYGIAIDINPKINPYYHIEKGIILPKTSDKYLDRTLQEAGMIHQGDVCYQAFIKRGYDWGGEKWDNRVDYHHFEKEIKDVL